MSKHRYLSNDGLFESDENEDEDDGFINGFRRRIPSPIRKPISNSNNTQIPGLQKQLMQKKLEIEQKTLDSASRSIALLEDAEDAGISAAKELAHQGEQLENANKKLDEVGANLKKSKKHINGIKSVFSEIKNYIASNSPPPLRRKISPKSRCASPSSTKNNDSTDNFHSHPATYLRNVDGQIASGPHTNSQQVDDILEASCDKMSQHLARLKGLGMELGHQIDQQNELIDTLNTKVEVADLKIMKQNKEMNKILGK